MPINKSWRCPDECAIVNSGSLHPAGPVVCAIPSPMYDHGHRWAGELCLWYFKSMFNSPFICTIRGICISLGSAQDIIHNTPKF